MVAFRKRLLLIVNDEGFFSHRLPVALAAQAAGYDVHVATGSSAVTAKITARGLNFHELRLSRGGTNPVRELIAFLDILRLLRRLHPDVLHLVTVKPVLYGGIAARFTQAPAVIMAVSGLGHVFAVDSCEPAACAGWSWRPIAWPSPEMGSRSFSRTAPTAICW